MNNLPESRTRVRFKDCDPNGHLYNTRFIEYMLEAREDQLLEHVKLNFTEYAEKRMMAWIIVKHEIRYLKEATRNEFVRNRSTIIEFDKTDIMVEYQMWDDENKKLKALLWTRFKHLDLTTKKATPHPPDIHQLLLEYTNEIVTSSIDDRIRDLLGR